VDWILDCDGVVWLAEDVIPGVPEAVGRLREAGHRILFLTNNSSRRVGDLVERRRGAVEAGALLSARAAQAGLGLPGPAARLEGL